MDAEDERRSRTAIPESGLPSERDVPRLDAELAEAYLDAWESTRWYSLARPHLAMHFRRQLRRLCELYDRPVQVPAAPLHDWASERVARLPDFARRFDPFPVRWRWLTKSWGVATFLTGATLSALPLLGVPVAATSSSALAFSIVDACFCKLWTIGFGSTYLAIWFYGVIGFWWKRDILMGGLPRSDDGSATTPNIYALEDRLFRSLGKRRGGEIQFDVVGAFALAFLLVGTYLVTQLLESVETFRWHFDWAWYSHPVVWAGAFVILGCVLAIQSTRRTWAWRG